MELTAKIQHCFKYTIPVYNNYLTEGEAPSGFAEAELKDYYRSFCQREPIAGMFLESVLEELMDPARDKEAFLFTGPIPEGTHPLLMLDDFQSGPRHGIGPAGD
jgi:hypothetical protein